MRRNSKTRGTVRVRGTSGVVFLSRRSVVSGVMSMLSIGLLVVSLTAIGIPVVPMVWYRLQPSTSAALASVLARPVVGFEETLVREGVRSVYQPPVDPSLPTENRLVIEKIGVDTEILEGTYEEHEEVFRKGVWRVPDFGTAYTRTQPMILAAHRFGYLAWTNAYRRENSFFNLPKLEEGDRVSVIWNQRKYTYEIYEVAEGDRIENYAADLILYTCKFLESDVRIFRYARLIEG